MDPQRERLDLKLRLGALQYSEELSQLPSGVSSRQKSECTPSPRSSDKPASGSLAPAMSSLGQHSTVSLQLLHAEPTAEAQGCLSDPDRFCLCTNSCSPARQLCHPGEVPARGPRPVMMRLNQRCPEEGGATGRLSPQLQAASEEPASEPLRSKAMM